MENNMLDVLQRARAWLERCVYRATPDICPDAIHRLVTDLLALVLDNPHRQVLEKRIAYHYSPESVGADDEMFVIDELQMLLRDADAQVKG